MDQESGAGVIAALRRCFPAPVPCNASRAAPGDPCGAILDGGAICEGTLECWTDVRGPIENCSCHINPPCGTCVASPLVCSKCDLEVGLDV